MHVVLKSHCSTLYISKHQKNGYGSVYIQSIEGILLERIKENVDCLSRVFR